MLLALVLAAGLVTGGALAVLRTDFVSNNLCGYAVANIEEATEARVKVARCTVDPARGQLVIEGLEAEAPDGRLKFSVARIFMQLVVRPLQQRVRLERLEVDHPDVEVTLGGPPSTRPKSDKCLPPKLTGFELGRVHIRKLAVHVTDPESGLSVDLPRSSAILRGAGTEARLQLEVHSGSVEIGERAAHLISAKVAAHVNLGGVGLVALDKADVIGAEASVFATGKLEDFCTPAIDTNVNVRVDDLGVLTDALLPHTLAGVKGSIATDASLEVVKNTVRLHGDVRTKDLALEGFSPGDVRARFDMTPKRLKVQKLQIGVGKAGEIGGTAELGIGDPDLPITADLQLKDMELAELLNKLGITGAWVVLRTNGKVQAKGTLNPLELNGNLGVDLAEFAIQDRRWEQRAKAKRTLEFGKGRLNASVNVNQQRVLMNKGTLEVEGSRLEVEGVFNTDFEKGLSLRGKADNFALDDFRGHLGTIPWKGRLGLAVTVNGQYNKPDIKAQVAGRNLHFLDLSLGDVAAQVHFNGMHLTFDDVHAKKDRSTYGGRVALDFNDPALPVYAHLELTDAYVHDLVDLAVNLVPTLSTMNDAKDVNGHVTGVLDAHGPVAGPEATASMDFDKVTLWGQTFEDGSAHFTLHGGEPQLIIDKFDLRHGEAWFKTAGTFGPQWALNVDSRTENFDLADLDSGAAAQLKGPLVANSHVRGVASHPLIDVDLTFKGGRAGKAMMGDGAMAMRIDGKDMTWRGTVGTHTLEGQGKLKDDFAYTSTLALKFPDLSDYFETFAPDAQLTGGAASALVQVHGSLLKWRQSAGSVTLSLLKFTRNGIAFTNDGNG
ncbi:MAG: hypothetical protein JST92_00120, partial [Deltaproteobacteria bacterium]|nr:hypothetical protein [Deltaproteobacteria bacterium]